ncbi:hypothetical protein F5Y03DRAFT_395351 [Xylaria venustula]|nr:hypothetical protein F5Y03DRAFT_395351 [Xylaria venustula]
MPSMAGTLGLGLGLGGLWELPSFAAPMATFVEDWFALQYLLPLISFVCVGLEGWCFFDLTRKTLGARSARAVMADAREAALDYDVVKDFPRGGFEPLSLSDREPKGRRCRAGASSSLKGARRHGESADERCPTSQYSNEKDRQVAYLFISPPDYQPHQIKKILLSTR